MCVVIVPVQVMQAQCVKAQTEFYRRSRTELIGGRGLTMGALYWQLNDIWQAPSWSSIGTNVFQSCLVDQSGFAFRAGFFSVCRVWWKVENAALLCARLFRRRPARRLRGRRRSARLRRVGPESRRGTCGCGMWQNSHPDLHCSTTNSWEKSGFVLVVTAGSVPFLGQVTVYSWADLDSACTLKSDRRLVPAGSAVAIFEQPVATLLAGCGRCTRFSCLLTFHLEDSGGQLGPTNHHFFSSPKDAQGLQRPNITVRLSDKQVFYFNWRAFAGV